MTPRVDGLRAGTTFITQTGSDDRAAAKPPKNAFMSMTFLIDGVPNFTCNEFL